MGGCRVFLEHCGLWRHRGFKYEAVGAVVAQETVLTGRLRINTNRGFQGTPQLATPTKSGRIRKAYIAGDVPAEVDLKQRKKAREHLMKEPLERKRVA